MLLPVASTLVVVGIAASAALGLLIVLFLRQTRRIDALTDDVERMERVQKDSAADVRARLEASAREVEAASLAVEPVAVAVDQVAAVTLEVGSLRGQVESQAPIVAGVGGRLDALDARVASLDERINEVEKLGSEGVAAVRAEWGEVEAMIDTSERQLAEVEAERAHEAKRLGDLRAAVGALRGTVEEKMDVQEDRLRVLESGPQSQIANAAAGLDPHAGESVSTPSVVTPSLARSPARAEEEQDDDTGSARWIFFMLAALLGLALLAQWIRAG